MKKITISLMMTSFIINFSCSTMNKTNQTTSTLEKVADQYADNPFFVKSKLQYQTPEFDKIKNKHYEPAFEYGLQEQLKEIDAITSNKENQTFNNTVLALENSGEVLKRAQTVFYNLSSSNTNDTIQNLQEKYAPIFAAHSDKIYLNDSLYKRLKAVNTKGLDSESKRLVEYYLQNFEIAGANLSEENKTKLKQINQQLASLSTQFSSKLLEARKQGALLIDDVKELDGLSEDDIAAAATDAKEAGHEGKYLLSLQNTTQQPLLQYLKNRKTREKLFKASWTRAEKGDQNDTRSTIDELAKLRLEKAKLFGFKNNPYPSFLSFL